MAEALPKPPCFCALYAVVRFGRS